MFCPNCGTQNPENAQTCTKCGFSMKSAAPKFKGTMLMMNQSGAPPALGAPRPAGGPAAPPPAVPPPPAAPGPASIGSGAPSAGAAPAAPSRLKGTIVGVAAPAAGAAPAPPAPPPYDPGGGYAAPEPPPPAPAPEQHQFGAGAGANPLGATIAIDGNHPVLPPGMGGPDMGAPPAFGAPPPNDPGGFGAPPPPDPYGGGMGMTPMAPQASPYGAPPQNPYGAPPPPDYGQPQQPYGMPPGPGMGGAMQPYAGGDPMAGVGMPGAMMAGGPPKSWMTTLLLALFLGYFGVHRFYTGHTLFGIIQLVTCGGFGIWAWVDVIFILIGKYTDAQGRPLQR